MIVREVKGPAATSAGTSREESYPLPGAGRTVWKPELSWTLCEPTEMAVEGLQGARSTRPSLELV